MSQPSRRRIPFLGWLGAAVLAISLAAVSLALHSPGAGAVDDGQSGPADRVVTFGFVDVAGVGELRVKTATQEKEARQQAAKAEDSYTAVLEAEKSQEVVAQAQEQVRAKEAQVRAVEAQVSAKEAQEREAQLGVDLCT